MKLSSLNLFSESDQIAWVGAGGKTSLIFSVAKELFANKCVITSTTKMAKYEIELADQSIKLKTLENFNVDVIKGITLIYQELVENDKTKIVGIEKNELGKLSRLLHRHQIPLLIEADGSQRKPSKFPASYEPNTPPFVNKVCVVVGLSAIGNPLTIDYFHRPEEISKVLNIPLGTEIKIEHIYTLLSHPRGGLKNIPDQAEKILFLNQADRYVNTKEINDLALKLKGFYDHVLLTEIHDYNLEIRAHWGKIGCVVLAAGEGSRFGGLKQLAIYQNKTFIENVIGIAQSVNFDQIVVVLGSNFEKIVSFINKDQIKVINNKDWKAGQSTSVKKGVSLFKGEKFDAILFLLVDQPQISISMINDVLNLFAYKKENIIVHNYKGQFRHPILFSKHTFDDLMEIRGDQGGRQLFKKFPPLQINLENDFLAIDIDTKNDLKKLDS